MNNVLGKKRETRYKFLKELYELTNGNTREIILLSDVGAIIGIDENESEAITQYLDAEKLIKYQTMGGGISITHSGVKEIEEALLSPERSTKYFPAINIINVGTMNNSQIQQGSHGSTQSQKVSIDNIQSALNKLLEEIHSQEEVTTGSKDLAEAYIDTLNHQIKMPTEHRDTSLIKKTWEKLSKLNTTISLSKSAYAAYQIAEPLVRSYFGI